MDTNENVKKKSFPKAIIILVILVVIASCIGFAYARYVAKINGQATAQIANYNLDITVGNTTNLNIDLANTRLANDTTKVASGQVAPDTKGAFNLNVDATGSNVSLIYNIDLDLSGAPENLKFYSDSNMKKEVMVQDNKIKIEDFIGVNDTKTNTITLYWAWPYETGENDYEIGLNDVKDSAWMERNIEIAVNATGKQVPGRVTYLADSVQIGDYVNYDATRGDGEGLSITPPQSQTGSSTLTTFNSSDITGWRVYDKDPITKTVTLIADEPTESTLTLYGKNGWKYGIDTLNSVGGIFGHGDGAYNARSIQEKDISIHSKYNPKNYINGQHETNGIKDNLGYYYYTGNTNRYETETYINGTFIMDNNSEVTATEQKPVTMRQTYYGYQSYNYINNTNTEPYYNLLIVSSADSNQYKESFWVATRFYYLEKRMCHFFIRRIGSGGVGADTAMFSSNPTSRSLNYAVMPMVTLQSNIQVTGQDSNNVWQLDLE